LPQKQGESGHETVREDIEDLELSTGTSEALAKEPKTGKPGTFNEEKKVVAVSVEAEEEEDEDDEQPDPPKIRKTLLIVGIMISVIGIIGVIGLRTNVIQHILGDPHPYPGIGYVEPWGHIVSMVPFIIGLLTVFVWGIKNDPIYYEMKKKEEDEEETIPPMHQTEVPEEFHEPSEPVRKKPAAVALIEATTMAKTKERQEMITKCEKLLKAVDIAPEDREKLRKHIPTCSTYQDFNQEVKKAVDRKRKEDNIPIEKEKISRPKKEVGELKKEPIPPIPIPVQKEDSIKAEQERASRCERMLAVANILPDDRLRLKRLIPTGISPYAFTAELKKAIERKKKKEEEKKLSADEKAAMLKKELAAELEQLEDALGKKTDEEDLEDLDL
jgi:hypothetical protein